MVEVRAGSCPVEALGTCPIGGGRGQPGLISQEPRGWRTHVGREPGWAGHQRAGQVVFPSSHSRASGMGLFVTQVATHGKKLHQPLQPPCSSPGPLFVSSSLVAGTGSYLPRLIPLQRGS